MLAPVVCVLVKLQEQTDYAFNFSQGGLPWDFYFCGLYYFCFVNYLDFASESGANKGV